MGLVHYNNICAIPRSLDKVFSIYGCSDHVKPRWIVSVPRHAAILFEYWDCGVPCSVWLSKQDFREIKVYFRTRECAEAFAASVGQIASWVMGRLGKGPTHFGIDIRHV